MRRADDYFSPATIASMESVAGRQLAELGYDSINRVGDRDPGRWRLRLWQVSDDLRGFLTLVSTQGRAVDWWRYVRNRLQNALRQKSTL